MENLSRYKFNPIRIEYLKNNIIRQFSIKNKNKPFLNLEILDIGCGGGLLTEPMCRLGGNLTGIDASKKNINIAKLHAKKQLEDKLYVHLQKILK